MSSESLRQSILDAADMANIGLELESSVSALGRMQRRLLVTLGDLTTPYTFLFHARDFESECRLEEWLNDSNEGHIEYTKITDRLVERADGRSRASIEAGVSRAVSSLIERGFVEGVVRSWLYVGTDEDGLGRAGRYPWSRDFRDSDDVDRPPIQYLRLRPDGWIAVYQILCNEPEEHETLLL